MMRQLITILLIYLISPLYACYNEYYALDSKGNFHQVEVGMIRFNKNFDLGQIQKKLISIRKSLENKQDFKLLSDYGLLLVKGGKVNEALILFEALANKYPNEYSIIANLGTTYELAGNNEKALEYIQKGLKINPNSHKGSEWIHVKLLEAKIALSKDPNYLKKNTILSLTAQQEESEKVREQLYIQLQERFPFCSGADPIMADLFEDLGDCYLHSISFEHAKGFYQIAKNYYLSESKTLDNKIENIGKLRSKYYDLQPTESEVEHGMVSKISGVPYKSFLVDKNPTNYTIDWSKIDLNIEQLLALQGISIITQEDVQKKDTLSTDKKNVTIEKPHSIPDSNSTSWLILIIIGLVGVILSLVIFLRKKR